MNDDPVCPHCGAKVPLAEGRTCKACGKAIAPRDPFSPNASDAAPSGEPQCPSKWPFLLGILAVMSALFMFGVLRLASESVNRSMCGSRLKELACGLHNFHQAREHFPPAYTVDEDGNRLHSWRVYVLPYMEEGELYEKIRLDEPWNSPYNRQFADKMPYLFRCPANPNQDRTDGITDYLMITGPGTVGAGPKGTSIKDITDGTANTIILIEVANSGINWMCPYDYDIAEAGFVAGPDGKGASKSPDTPKVSSYHATIAQALLCDGMIKCISKSIDPELLEGLFTINGGEDVSEFHSPR